jgi:alpha-beta hydrolase superfamily lysophospholipase
MEIEERTVAGPGGARIFARMWRPDEPPRAAIAAVHGFGDHSGRYGELLARLVEYGFTVHALDLRGHGRSAGQRGHLDSWADYRDDLSAFIGDVREREGPDLPIYLMGNSLGGLVALEFALRRPHDLAGVIADSPALVPSGVGNRFLKFLAIALSRVWPRFAVSVPMAAEPSVTMPVTPVEERDPLLHSRLSARAATEAMSAIQFTRDNARRLRLPLLVVHGGADRVVDPSGSRAFVRDAASEDKTLIEYPGVFHDGRDEDVRSRIIRDVAAWIDRRIAPAA